jgi:Leucine-rich repeat (LRR) protein
LSELELSDFPKLKRLEGLTELPCLEKLVLKKMTALRSIGGGPFPSLSELSMDGMPSLGVVWIVTEGSMADVEGGQLQIGNRLSALAISKCPKLMVMPYFPLSLKELLLVKSNVQLLGSSLPSFSFSCLKELLLNDMAPPAGEASYGSGCRWELLKHLTALKSMKIVSCDGLTELPESMRSLASLRTLSISLCSALCMLPEWLAELHYLEMMSFYKCGSMNLAPSMQPLRALKALDIYESGWVGDLCSPSLQTLSIQYCGSISSLPHKRLTSLTNLRLAGLPSSFQQSLGHLTSLQELQIDHCYALGHFPECVGELHSLRIFQIWELPCLTCLPQSLGHLTSLQELRIGNCNALDQLPESLGELRSLRKFEIWDLPGLTSVPKSMCCLTSLEQLTIRRCPGIRSLAEWIKGLTALQTLEIYGCPDLERRCERRKGKDWHLISHIPHLWIG